MLLPIRLRGADRESGSDEGLILADTHDQDEEIKEEAPGAASGAASEKEEEEEDARRRGVKRGTTLNLLAEAISRLDLDGFDLLDN